MNVAIRALRLLRLFVLVNGINLVVSIAYSAFYGLSFFQGIRDVFVTLQFIEAGMLFLIGGLISYGGTVFVTKVKQFLLKVEEEWTPEKSIKAEKNALILVVLAVILFAESTIVSFFI